MAYKIFISHSTKDLDLVDMIAEIIKQRGAFPYISGKDESPGMTIKDQVKANIKDSKCVFVVLTKDGANAEWVSTEIGIAIGMDKIIIPFIEKGVTLPDALVDIKYITFDRTDSDSFSPSLKSLKRSIDDLVERENRQTRNLLMFLGGALILGLLFGDDKDDDY